MVESWKSTETFTTMHRPGIAKVIGDRIILDGATIEEVERYHRDTLVSAVRCANKIAKEYLHKVNKEKEERERLKIEHAMKVEEGVKRIKFD